MTIKSFVTRLPDKSGMFLRAARVIACHGGNIIRVSFNKAVDLHTLFIDVEASEEKLAKIEKSLSDIGYIYNNLTETRVIEILIKIPDKPGAVLPVLEILNKYDINISYMNSFANNKPYQDFKFGLLIDDPCIIKTLLDDISKVYPVNIVECETAEENLDNTVFYIRLANEMQKMLGLSTEKTMKFISESNRILQVLQSEGEDAHKVFNYIRRFASTVSSYRGVNFKTNIEKIILEESVEVYSIQPYCGSNTYILVSENELVLIDTGYAIYENEMMLVFKELVPDWDRKAKKVYITHADNDHCGLLSKLDQFEIIVNEKSAENFKRQHQGLPDYREQTELAMGYNKISQIISGYVPPDLKKLKILDVDTPKEHDLLIPVGSFSIGNLEITILEGSGGHLNGEMIYVSPKAGIVFTGDDLVNINDFSKERAEFNSLAPYLMKSVNVDSKKATEVRRQIMALIQDISDKNSKPCIICGGHGPVSELLNGKLVSIRRKDKEEY